MKRLFIAVLVIAAVFCALSGNGCRPAQTHHSSWSTFTDDFVND